MFFYNTTIIHYIIVKEEKMIYNIISLLSFLIIVLICCITKRFKCNNIILQSISVIIFLSKLFEYIVNNIQGNITIPVEISTISYFIVSIIIAFKIEKMYNIASFFGIVCGLGYFLFYIILGFTVENEITTKGLIEGIFCHGYLLITGIYIFTQEKFNKEKHYYLWITILGIISWSMVFFDIEQRGITFIYYIIKPTYLFVSEQMIINVAIIMTYYIIILILFYTLIKLFYRFNNKLYDNKIQYKKIKKIINFY